MHRLHIQRTEGQTAAAASTTDASVSNYHPWVDPRSAWVIPDPAGQSDAEVLEEEMLRAGIMASLQDVIDNPGAKVEVPKSSVSSLRSVTNFLFLNHFKYTFFITFIKNNSLSDSNNLRRWASRQRKL